MSTDQQTTTSGAGPEPATSVDRPDQGMSGGQWVRLGLVLAALVWLTAATGVYGLAMVLGIVVMIFLHELGHFVMARRAGMKCTEFFIGFGPRIWSFHRGETEYGLKLIPAGAYVKVVGMHDIEEVDPADEARTYRQQPFWQRFGVAVAGSTMHFIIALVLLYVILVGFGVSGGSLTDPDMSRWRVGAITADSAADRAGLETGDDVVAIDGTPVATFDDLRDTVAERPGDEVVLTVARDGDEREVAVTLGQHPADRRLGFLGVGQDLPEETLSPVAAVPGAFRELGAVSIESVKALGRFFTPGGISDFGRQVVDARSGDAPADEGSSSGSGSGSRSSSAAAEEETGENRLLSLLGVFRIGVDAGELGGAASLILLFISINIFIGIFNLVPMLPFDGGHLAIAVYEKVQEWRLGLGKRYFADVARLLPMTYAVVVVLGLIFVSTLYLDIANPLSVR